MLQKTLASAARLKTLIKKELMADAEKFGDARRSRLVERAPAQALDETALVPSEPVTIVLSKNGWVRVAKGHEIDPAEMNYKAGDGFAAAARCRSNELVVFIDSTGRTYALPAHSLPTARGQGEPLSGRLKPADGARFVGVMSGDPDRLYLLASDSGYGFVARLGDMYSRNKAGKATLSVPGWCIRAAAGCGAKSQGRLDRGGDQRGLYAGAPAGGAAANGARQGQQDNQYSVRQAEEQGGVCGRDRLHPGWRETHCARREKIQDHEAGRGGRIRRRARSPGS